MKGNLLTVSLILTALALPTQAAAEHTSPVHLVLVEGTHYTGELLSLDGNKARLLTADGKTIEIARDEVAFINFHPDWVAVKAYGVTDQTYCDFNAGFAVPLPAEAWVPAYDSEGHLFLSASEGTAVLGFYAYTTKYPSLDDFLTAHASWRRTAGMPEGSYTAGNDTMLGGRPARAFVYDTKLQGRPARAMDIKTIGPRGHGLVVTLMCSSVAEGDFRATQAKARAVLETVRFFEQGG